MGAHIMQHGSRGEKGTTANGIVRTVLGDVAPEALGRVSAHEHIVVMGGLACLNEPEFRLDDIDRISGDVAAFRDSGGGAVVDAFPLVEGRSAGALRAVSERTGVHVVASTGFLPLRYYTDLHWVHCYSMERLAQLLVDEIEQGMDEHCHNGPDPHRSRARAGVVKVSGSFHHVPSVVARTIAAAGRAHEVTGGVPIIVHTEQGTAGHEMLDLLESAGIRPDRVLLSHMDRNPDIVLHAELAARGVMLGYDWLARIRQRPDSVITELIVGMAEHGSRQPDNPGYGPRAPYLLARLRWRPGTALLIW
jgi:phosphotriesterase-related protein